MWCIHCFQLVQSTFPTSRNVGDIFPSLMTESMQQETPLPAARFVSKHPRTRTAYLLHAARRQYADAECGSSLSIFKPRSKASHSNTNKKSPAQIQVLSQSNPHCRPPRSPWESAPSCGRSDCAEQQVYGGRDR